MSYFVEVTPEAEADIENIFGYVSTELEAPDSAFKLVNDIYDEIDSLADLPKRNQVINREPWRSRGVRFAYVKNFRIHYIVNDDQNKVIVFNVMYYRKNS